MNEAFMSMAPEEASAFAEKRCAMVFSTLADARRSLPAAVIDALVGKLPKMGLNLGVNDILEVAVVPPGASSEFMDGTQVFHEFTDGWIIMGRLS